MKKLIRIIVVLFSISLLASCNSNVILDDNYNEEAFGYLDIEKDEIKIMQLTDMHLTYGFDALDRKTFKMLDKLVANEEPDFIVLTGDMFMSIFAKPLLKKLIKKMESYKIPWAYTFGNHEREYHKEEVMVNILMNAKTEYLIFHYGPKLSSDNSHGYSNYKIKITNGSEPLLNLYLLDSKDRRKDGIKDDRYPYDYLSIEQVGWFSDNLAGDSVSSLAFMHIPLLQFEEYEGVTNESIWPQAIDTGFFDAIINNGKKTIAVFIGHDHKNNHEFYYDDILLAYGVSSGYNAYGSNATKGAKIIIYNKDGTLNTYNVFGKDI